MTLEFHCADVGVACKAKTTATTEDELVAKVAAHAKEEHGVELTDTLVDYAVSQIRKT